MRLSTDSQEPADDAQKLIEGGKLYSDEAREHYTTQFVKMIFLICFLQGNTKRRKSEMFIFGQILFPEQPGLSAFGRPMLTKPLNVVIKRWLMK